MNRIEVLVKDKTNLIIGLSGILILILSSLLVYISPDFSDDVALTQRPVLLLVAILVGSGTVYLVTILKIHRIRLTNKQLIWIIAVGVVLRILTLFSVPILEDDYFRYLWDGAVTANGGNPYEYSPKEIIEGKDVPPELSLLVEESGDIVHKINHPDLRTIYPPLAQAFFALSHWVQPWSLIPWKVILIILDLATLSLILKALGILKLPNSYLMIYWWNPLLLKEIFNSCHLDLLVFPFVLSSLITAAQNKRIRSMLSLIIGVGIKLWPAFLLPIILRPLIYNPKKLLGTLAVTALCLGALFLPIYSTGLDQTSGFIAYGKSWQNNDSIFRIITFISGQGLNLLGYESFIKYKVARVITLAIIGIWIVYLTISRNAAKRDFFEKCLLIVAFIFLVIPTQFPWYYTWILPFLVVKPRFSLLFLTVLLPLYYLRYYFEPRGEIGLFTNVIVWVEFVPVWLLLLWEWRKGHGLVLARRA